MRNRVGVHWCMVVVTTMVAALVASGATGQVKKKPKSKACAETLDACPEIGCGQPGTPQAVLNKTKRNEPGSSGGPIHLQLQDFEALQQQADDLVGQRVSLTKADRNKLRKLKIGHQQVGEGDFVEVQAFLVGNPHPNTSGESVNCRLKGSANNDFHIPVAEQPDDTEFQAVVVEMIPQNANRKNREWTLAKLKSIEKQERPVLIRGQLFYDSEHEVNDDEENVKGGQPKRFSLWELHPVTEFFACMAQDKKCDPNAIGQWTPLEKVTGHQ